MRKFTSAIALIAVALVSLLAVASPAQAAVSHNCPENTVCLYQWLNYGAPAGDASPGWKSSFYNLNIHINGCVALDDPMAYWPNGTVVHDNAGSIVVNGNGDYDGTWYLSIYSWDNCNSQGGVSNFPVDRITNYNDLSLIPLGGGRTAYHNIGSISLHHLPN